MELPIPTLTTSQTVLVALLCFIAALFFFGGRWAKAKLASLKLEFEKPAFLYPQEWDEAEKAKFRDEWLDYHRAALVRETGDDRVYSMNDEDRPASYLFSNSDMPDGFSSGVCRDLGDGTRLVMTTKLGALQMKSGFVVERVVVDARSATEAPSQPKVWPQECNLTPDQIAALKRSSQCPTPPNGWDCSRDIGHPGPCAASPTDDIDDEEEAPVGRNILAVIAQMAKIDGLPKDVCSAILSVGVSEAYTAPEDVGRRWEELGAICSLAVDEKPYADLAGWERELIDILIDKATSASESSASEGDAS